MVVVHIDALVGCEKLILKYSEESNINYLCLKCSFDLFSFLFVAFIISVLYLPQKGLESVHLYAAKTEFFGL